MMDRNKVICAMEPPLAANSEQHPISNNNHFKIFQKGVNNFDRIDSPEYVPIPLKDLFLTYAYRISTLLTVENIVFVDTAYFVFICVFGLIHVVKVCQHRKAKYFIL